MTHEDHSMPSPISSINPAASQPAPLTAQQAALKPHLAAANIDERSFLATDYLNHYNEVVMLLEMAPDMPDMLEDAADWTPKSYQQHFADSGFADKALAIEAYDHAPGACRLLFDTLRLKLDALLLQTVGDVVMLGDDAQAIARHLEEPLKEAQELLSALNGVIHGKTEQPSCSPAQEDEGDPIESTAASQADIDALFD
ncbi:hypothetical protein [Iodidimonas sp. MBR-55]|jgi:hypothetical protein|uniref:hypothetical protein n=2 Tax=Iodidimonas TaxID=2066486 RepID=UPI002483263F|nr:hypothetical protein [Iodidimonas sp. MBR-55]